MVVYPWKSRPDASRQAGTRRPTGARTGSAPRASRYAEYHVGVEPNRGGHARRHADSGVLLRDAGREQGAEVAGPGRIRHDSDHDFRNGTRILPARQLPPHPVPRFGRRPARLPGRRALVEHTCERRAGEDGASDRWRTGPRLPAGDRGASAGGPGHPGDRRRPRLPPDEAGAGVRRNELRLPPALHADGLVLARADRAPVREAEDTDARARNLLFSSASSGSATSGRSPAPGPAPILGAVLPVTNTGARIRPGRSGAEAHSMRRLHLRGRVNIGKRVLIQAAGFDLGLLMRHRCGIGKPRRLQDRRIAAGSGILCADIGSERPYVRFWAILGVFRLSIPRVPPGYPVLSRRRRSPANSPWKKSPASAPLREGNRNPPRFGDAGHSSHGQAGRIASAIRPTVFRGEGGPSPHPSPAALRAASAREGLCPQPANC